MWRSTDAIGTSFPREALVTPFRDGGEDQPHRTIVNPEERQIEVLNQALKQAIVKELQDNAKTV
ncbi:hypothetical protein AC480_04880 [miscellaneous Crenarchaeota group archaeon SMTZ1-55]|nr:MAG: hypothetical protein AC480_04880 [miscellaneous Crenarchaeota group archaeon SMTZ1-55]